MAEGGFVVSESVSVVRVPRLLPAGVDQATRLDGRAGAELKRLVAGLLTGGEQLRLDLSAVTFIDSSGLGAIVSLIKLIGSRGDLEITGVGPRVHEMLQLTHLDRVLRVVA